MFGGFKRKKVLKAIHILVQQNYSYEELIKLSLIELADIETAIVSLQQQETLSKAGF